MRATVRTVVVVVVFAVTLTVTGPIYYYSHALVLSQLGHSDVMVTMRTYL